MADYQAKLSIEKESTVAQADKRLFSSFLEHLGVYTGIYEPRHPLADKNGFRTDVLQMVRELGISHVRYPGENFLSGYRNNYNWMRSIDKFCDWAGKAGVSVMGVVDTSTDNSPQKVGALVKYCNYPTSLHLRARNGHRELHNIKLWYVGDNSDGKWQQPNPKNAVDYGKKVRETAEIMKRMDRKIELIVRGSANTRLYKYPEWSRIVLEHTYEDVDYISLHTYYENEEVDYEDEDEDEDVDYIYCYRPFPYFFGKKTNRIYPRTTYYENDRYSPDFLASFVDMENFIHTMVCTCDYVQAVKRSAKKMMLSFDVWYQQNQFPYGWMDDSSTLAGRYPVRDALAFAGMGMTLLNHSDRVRIACFAQPVNIIAPIFPEKGGKAFRQATYYPFQLLSRYGGKGKVLKPVVFSPITETHHGVTPLLHSSVVYDEEEKMITVFLLNISSGKMRTKLSLRSFGSVRMTERLCMTGSGLSLKNTFEHPDRAAPVSLPCEKGSFDTCTVELEKTSWNVLRFRHK